MDLGLWGHVNVDGSWKRMQKVSNLNCVGYELIFEVLSVTYDVLDGINVIE